ncbi:MAG: hypothetical protein V3V68_05030 [Nitrosomonadaceae bacterium]
MRIPKYLSPTSISLWQKDEELFYQRYLSDNRLPREPQTQPMSIGSAFDAFCKSYLHESLFGKGADSRYDRGAIFEEQVQEHNRDWAWENGALVFDAYKRIGCLADLMLELSTSVNDPRFEFTIQDTVTTSIGEIPLLGKPDIFFINNEGARVILDWKVNGYCAKSLKSPMKGYVKLREFGKGIKVHKDCHLMKVNGMFINVAMGLEDGDKSWADQLAIYSWLLGEPFGSSNMITGIDQICGPKDRLRFANHRLRIGADYQFELLALIEQLWETIQSGHIFSGMLEEESHARCALLDEVNYSNSDFQDTCR